MQRLIPLPLMLKPFPFTVKLWRDTNSSGLSRLMSLWRAMHSASTESAQVKSNAELTDTHDTSPPQSTSAFEEHSCREEEPVQLKAPQHEDSVEGQASHELPAVDG